MERRDASGIPGGGGLCVAMDDEDDVLDDGNDDDGARAQGKAAGRKTRVFGLGFHIRKYI